MGEYSLKIEGSNKAVFFDRDGVIIKAIIRSGHPFPPQTLSDVEIFPEAYTVLNSLSAAGYLLIIVTNQPDVARGNQDQRVVEEIHDYLCKELPITKIMVCYHDDKDQCNCRKPAPGLLIEAAKIHGIDLEKSYMVGDRWRDIEAGQRAGCKTIFIDYDYQEQQPNLPTFRVRSLFEIVKIILKEEVTRSVLS